MEEAYIKTELNKLYQQWLTEINNANHKEAEINNLIAQIDASIKIALKETGITYVKALLDPINDLLDQDLKESPDISKLKQIRVLIEVVADE